MKQEKLGKQNSNYKNTVKKKKEQGREEPQLIKKKIYAQREREGKLRETSVVSAGGGAVFPLPFRLSHSQLC